MVWSAGPNSLWTSAPIPISGHFLLEQTPQVGFPGRCHALLELVNQVGVSPAGRRHFLALSVGSEQLALACASCEFLSTFFSCYQH